MILLASDYDGTLKQQGKIDDSDIEAIHAFQKAGHQFAIITGRSLSMIQHELKKYKIPFDYLICGNGAFIADQQLNVLERFDLPYSLAKQIIDECSLIDGVSIGVSDGDLFGALKTHGEDYSDEMFDDQSDGQLVLSKQKIGMVFLQHETEEKTLQLKSELEKKYSDFAQFHYNKGAINISSCLVSKQTGVAALLKRLQCIVVTIGDGYNDIPMIEAFDGFAIENAPLEVRQKATAVYPQVKDCLMDLLKKEK